MKWFTKLLIMIAIVPNLVQSGDAGDSTLIALGSQAGGQDMAINLGSGPKRVTLKRDGTLLDNADLLDGLPLAGSSIIAQSHGLTTSLATSMFDFSANVVFVVMVNVPSSAKVNGVIFVQTVQGVYSASDTNQIGLYSFSGGVLTRIAQSEDNRDLWKQSVGTLHGEPFTSPVTIAPGVYWIAALWNAGTVSVDPEIAAGAQVISGAMSLLDLPDQSATYGAATAGYTELPSTLTMTSDVGAIADRPWLALY